MRGAVWIARSTMHELPEFRRQQEQGTVRASLYGMPSAIIARALHEFFDLRAWIDHILCGHHLCAGISDFGGSAQRGRCTLAFYGSCGCRHFGDPLRRPAFRPHWTPVGVDRALRRKRGPPDHIVQSDGQRFSRSSTAWACTLAALAGAFSAVGAAATAEQFPAEGRVTGLALGATMATAVFGGLTPYAAQLLLERTGWNMTPGAMIAVVALCVLPVFVSMRETAPR